MKINASARILIILAGLYTAGSANLSADESGELWYPVPPDRKHDTIVTQLPTLREGYFVVSALYTMYSTNRAVDENGDIYYPGLLDVLQNYGVKISALYGLTDRIELGASLPVAYRMLTRTIHDNTIGENSRQDHSAFGIGDATFSLGLRILDELPFLPSVVLYGDALIPTGRKNPYPDEPELGSPGKFEEWKKWYETWQTPLGSGSYRFGLGAYLSKIVYPFRFLVSGTYNYHLEGRKLFKRNDFWMSEEIPFRYGDSVYAGTEVSYLVNTWIAMKGELLYTCSFQDRMNDTLVGVQTWNLNCIVSFFLQLASLRIRTAVSLPVAGVLASADPIIISGLQYVF